MKAGFGFSGLLAIHHNLKEFANKFEEAEAEEFGTLSLSYAAIRRSQLMDQQKELKQRAEQQRKQREEQEKQERREKSLSMIKSKFLKKEPSRRSSFQSNDTHRRSSFQSNDTHRRSSFQSNDTHRRSSFQSNDNSYPSKSTSSMNSYPSKSTSSMNSYPSKSTSSFKRPQTPIEEEEEYEEESDTIFGEIEEEEEEPPVHKPMAKWSSIVQDQQKKEAAAATAVINTGDIKITTREDEDFNNLLSFISGNATLDDQLQSINDDVYSRISKSERVLNSISSTSDNSGYKEKLERLNHVHELIQMCKLAETTNFNTQLALLERFINNSKRLTPDQWESIDNIIVAIRNDIMMPYSKRTFIKVCTKAIVGGCLAVSSVTGKSNSRVAKKISKVTRNGEAVGRFLVKNDSTTNFLADRVLKQMGSSFVITPEIESYINTGFDLLSGLLQD